MSLSIDLLSSQVSNTSGPPTLGADSSVVTHAVGRCGELLHHPPRFSAESSKARDSRAGRGRNLMELLDTNKCEMQGVIARTQTS